MALYIQYCYLSVCQSIISSSTSVCIKWISSADSLSLHSLTHTHTLNIHGTHKKLKHFRLNFKRLRNRKLTGSGVLMFTLYRVTKVFSFVAEVWPPGLWPITCTLAITVPATGTLFPTSMMHLLLQHNFFFFLSLLKVIRKMWIISDIFDDGFGVCEEQWRNLCCLWQPLWYKDEK